MNYDTKWEDMKWEIDFYYRKLVRSPFYTLKYGIKNLWKWKGIIWEDRDWDYFYLLHILEFKMRNMHTEITTKPIIMHTEKMQILSLKVCAELACRLKESEYNEERLNKLFRSVPFFLDRSNDYIHPKGYHRALKREIQKEQNLRKQDKEMFARYFCKYLHRWWE